MVDLEYFNARMEKARKIYDAQKSIYNPYFQNQIILNSDGFHHLQFSARKERSKEEQLLKFSLLPLALEIIKKSGTIQEYRKTIVKYGKKSKIDGLTRTKEAEFWAFIAIVGEKKIRIKVIIKRIGSGNIIFWSVMTDSNLRKGQKLFTDDIENS